MSAPDGWPASPPPPLLLFATQTGNSKCIAEDLRALLLAQSCECRLLSLADYVATDPQLLELAKEPLVLLIVATTGQGDYPDSARTFARVLRRIGKTGSDVLSNTRIAVLGLGDTNYTNFNAAAVRLHKSLVKAGAKDLLPISLADDGVGLDLVVEPWKLSVVRAVAGPTDGSAAVADEQPTAPADDGTQDDDGPLILVASQTGNGKEIATALCESLIVKHGYPMTRVNTMDQFVLNHADLDALAEEKCILWIVSTTGQGDYPDNARKFMRAFRKMVQERPSVLQSVKVAVLGLGDSNYSNFNAAALRLHKLLLKAGASDLLPLALADDGLGLEGTVEPWRLDLLPVLARAMPPAGSNALIRAAVPVEPPSSLGCVSPLILVASQGGNGRHIAFSLSAAFVNTHGYPGTRVATFEQYLLNNADLEALRTEVAVIWIVATTGQGEYPDTARKFVRVLRKRCTETPTFLVGVRTAVLGLGDSNYGHFNAAAQRLHKVLLKAGAQDFMPLALADDGTSLEAVVEPWQRNVVPALASLLPQSPTAAAVEIFEVKTQSAPSSPAKPAPESPVLRSLLPQPPIRRDLVSVAAAAAVEESQDVQQQHQSEGLSDPRLQPMFLFGSQTGNAQQIARMLHTEALIKYPGSQLSPMNAFFQLCAAQARARGDVDGGGDQGLVEGLQQFKIQVYVISSNGQGDPPDNARQFVRHLRRAKMALARLGKPLAGVRFTVLGLGDSNYAEFNSASNSLDQLLVALGAQRFYRRGDADDMIGLDQEVQPWMRGLWSALTLVRQTFQDAPESGITGSLPVGTLVLSPSAVSVPESAEPPPLLVVPSVAAAATVVEDAPAPPPPQPVLGRTGCSLLQELSSRALRPAVAASAEPALRPSPVVPKPKGLPRKRRCSVVTEFPEDHAVATAASGGRRPYFLRRFAGQDTETELVGYTPEAPCLATVARARLLTRTSDRVVVHMELELPQQDRERVVYVPGDSIGVYCPNAPAEVARLLELLELDGDRLVSFRRQADPEDLSPPQSPTSSAAGGALAHVPSPCTIREALTYCFSLSGSVSKLFLRLLADSCVKDSPTYVSDKTRLYHLASRDGREDYLKEIVAGSPSLVQLLERYPSARPGLDLLVSQLAPLIPRYYSVASSPLAHPTTVHIAFSLVRFSAQDVRGGVQRRDGVCTNWLYALAKRFRLFSDVQDYDRELVPSGFDYDRFTGEFPGCVGADTASEGLLWPRIPIFLRRSRHFYLPEDLGTPIIMVGPGTGVSPFRGFLQHRLQERQAVKCGGCGSGFWRGLDMGLEDDEEDLLEAAGGLMTLVSSDEPSDEETAGDSDGSGGGAGAAAMVSWPPTPFALTSAGPEPVAALAGNRNWSWPSLPTLLQDQDQDMLDAALPLSPSNPSAAAAVPQFGRMTLFFGCRHPERDFLYTEDWEHYVQGEALDQFVTAFSRFEYDVDSPEADVIRCRQLHKQASGASEPLGLYVQDRLREHGAEIVRQLLEEDAYFFVCGDGNRMAKQVHQALVELFVEHAGMTPVEARRRLAHMMDVEHPETHRYIQDIWS